MPTTKAGNDFEVLNKDLPCPPLSSFPPRGTTFAINPVPPSHPSSRHSRIFMDPHGFHLLAATTAGEMYYLHARSIKVTPFVHLPVHMLRPSKIDL
jgi:hypothetical protein